MAQDVFDPRSGFTPDWVQPYDYNAGSVPNLLAALGMQTQRQAPFVGGAQSWGERNTNDWQNFVNQLAAKDYTLNRDFKDGSWITQVTDRQGNPIGQADKAKGSSMLEMLSPVLLAAGVGGLQGMGLLGDSTFGMGGLGGAGAGGLGETAALGMDQVAALGGAPEAAAGSGIGTLGGGTELAYTAAPDLVGLGAMSPEALAAITVPDVAIPGFGAAAGGALSSADKAAMFGNEGYGAGMTGAQTGAFDSVLGATGSTGLAGAASSLAGISPGLGNLVGGVASGIGGIVDGLGGMKNVLPLLGAAAGAASGGGSTTATTQQHMDPRMDAYVYGNGKGDPQSLLGAAWNQFQQNPSGINATMQQGLDMQKAALTDPAYGQAYTNMRNVGNGLLSQGVASNPFTTGARQLPNMQAGGVGGLLGGSVQDLIKAGRGILG